MLKANFLCLNIEVQPCLTFKQVHTLEVADNGEYTFEYNFGK